MASVEESIDVNVDVSTAYNQWTQFEQFPQFMDGVKSVTRTGDRQMHWVADIVGGIREWDAQITEQVPDRRIVWASTSGQPNGGIVTFSPLGPSSCEVTLRIDYQPEGFMEHAGSMLGLVGGQVRGDLERFKQYIERRGQETGGWRGEIAV